MSQRQPLHKLSRAGIGCGDGLLAAVLLGLGGLALLGLGGLLAAGNRLLIRAPRRSRRTLLCLVPSGLEEIVAKGVGEMIGEREEQGYFTRVHAVYHPSQGWGRVAWGERQTVWKIPLVCRWLRAAGFRRCYETINGCLLMALAALASPWVRRRIDVIRGQDPAIMGVVAAWLVLLTGRPGCISIHADHDKRAGLDPARGTVSFWGRRALAVWLERWALRIVQQVWVIRPSLIPWVHRRGVSPACVRVIPHGIVPQEWQLPGPACREFRERQGLNGQQVVLFVGRVERVNYAEEALRIAASVYASRRNVKFVFLGDGTQRKPLEILGSELGVAEAIQWKGFRPREEVRLWRNVSDVQLCLMGGYSLLEAAASGRAVVSYDVEWHRDVVRDQETGRLISEHDVAAAAAAVQELLDRPETAARLGQQAQALVAREFTARQAQARRVACYEALITGRES